MNFTGEPIRSVRIASNRSLMRETEKDGARAEPVHEKIMRCKKSKIIQHKIQSYLPTGARPWLMT